MNVPVNNTEDGAVLYTANDTVHSNHHPTTQGPQLVDDRLTRRNSGKSLFFITNSLLLFIEIHGLTFSQGSGCS